MTALSRPFRRITRRAGDAEPATVPVPQAPVAATEQPDIAIDIPESDPLFAYLQAAPGPVDLARLELASPALDALRAGGVALVVPLVTQGELIGTLNLGPRLSEQDYSSDDRRLLRHARRPGRARDPGRAARPRAGRRGRRARALRAGAQGRDADPAAVPAARAAEAARVADRGLLRAGPRGRRRLLRLHRAAATGGSASSSATSPTRASRPRWSWRGRVRGARTAAGVPGGRAALPPAEGGLRRRPRSPDRARPWSAARASRSDFPTPP